MNIILKNGGKITEQGYVGLSRKKKNQVISNAIGAAAFNGSIDVLKQLMSKSGSILNINQPAIEKLDYNQKGPLVKEYAGFTPIMLAVAEGAQNIEAVRILLANKADTTILDTYGNNILHIAAHYQNIDAIEYLTLNSQKLNILERNQNGETPMSIVQEKKNERGIKILERFISVSGDSTK